MLSYKLLLVFNKFRFSIFCIIMAISTLANSAVNVDKSRIVFPSGSLSASISLHNSEKEPALVQLWTDKGNQFTTPDSVRTPIIVNPPVFKMQPGEVRNIRLMLVSPEDLPRDRESIFWLNIYQMPPNTGLIPREQKKVILPLKIRLKIFFRPSSMKNISLADYAKLSFKQTKGTEVMVINPTGWYITIPYIIIGKDQLKSCMLAPFTQTKVHLSEEAAKGMSVRYNVIDDQGSIATYESALQ
jgi:P pilus assembly chaperone PapD